MPSERIIRNLSISGTKVHRVRVGDVVKDQHGQDWAVVGVEQDTQGVEVAFVELDGEERRSCRYSSRNTLAINGRVSGRQAERLGIEAA